MKIEVLWDLNLITVVSKDRNELSLGPNSAKKNKYILTRICNNIAGKISKF
jgi:hypothetical protein